MTNKFDDIDGRPKIERDALLDRLQAVQHQQEARTTAKPKAKGDRSANITRKDNVET